MKMRIALLSLLTVLCLMVVAAPAMADTLYDNGPVNGSTDAWTINFGFTVSDSFNCSNHDCDVEDLHIGVWLFPGDNLGSVDIDLGSTSFGADYGHVGAAAATLTSDLGINQYGYDIRIYSFTFPSIDVPGGISYITLGNAVETVFGDPVYWDENSGAGCTSPGCPSTAYENTIGSIPSEAFTLTGTPTQTGTTPEPTSIMLFGSGILGLAGILRRRLNR